MRDHTFFEAYKEMSEAGRTLWQKCEAVTFSSPHHVGTSALQNGRGIGIWKSIPLPDFGRPFQYSTRGRETRIYCRVLEVEV